MEVRDAIKLAVDHLADAGAPHEVAPRLIEAGYSSAKAEGLSAACVLACETARGASALVLAELQATLTAAGTRADLAALIAVEVFSDQSPELRLGEVAGVPVLQLLGDLGRLDSQERLAIREELLEPLFARDCRLVVDLGGLSDAPLEVFGILCSDLATLRAAGGDLVLTGLDGETQELAAAYRLAELIPLASDPDAALERLGKLPCVPAAGKRFVVLRGAAEGAGILAVRGAIDARSVERAERKVRKVLAKHERLVLDLREVPWISPEGFAFLRAITAELGERIKVARLLGPAAAAAAAERLSEAVTIYADRREALDAFGPAPTEAAPVTTSSEDLASDEVVEAEDPADERAETQAAPVAAAADVAGQPEPEPSPAEQAEPKPRRPEPPGDSAPEAKPPEAKPKRTKPKTKRQAKAKRKSDLEEAKLKAARAAKRRSAASEGTPRERGEAGEADAPPERAEAVSPPERSDAGSESPPAPRPNAERDATQSAKQNAESDAKQSAKQNAESDAKQDAESNASQDAEPEAEQDVELA